MDTAVMILCLVALAASGVHIWRLRRWRRRSVSDAVIRVLFLVTRDGGVVQGVTCQMVKDAVRKASAGGD